MTRLEISITSLKISLGKLNKNMQSIKQLQITLDKVENIEISRSYSRKLQVKQYEPMEVFSSYKAVMKPQATNEEINQVSQELYSKAKDEVDTEIEYAYQAINPIKDF